MISTQANEAFKNRLTLLRLSLKSMARIIKDSMAIAQLEAKRAIYVACCGFVKRPNMIFPSFFCGKKPITRAVAAVIPRVQEMP